MSDDERHDIRPRYVELAGAKPRGRPVDDPRGKTARADCAATDPAHISAANSPGSENLGRLRIFRDDDFPGPLSAAAFREHPAKFWAVDVIEMYERCLAPLPLKRGTDAVLARLISEARSPYRGGEPAPVLRGEIETLLAPPRGSWWSRLFRNEPESFDEWAGRQW